MKLLSIGNSFSQDAHQFLHRLAVANDFELETYNLHIGGCSLETHWNNFTDNVKPYGFYYNGERLREESLCNALSLYDYDIITFQQASRYSGVFESYEPYLSNLSAEVRKLHPKAKFYFQQTWAYEIDSGHSGFATYDRDQKNMFRMIVDASTKALSVIKGEMIPTGTAIQQIRETVPEFDYANGGFSLCRDGHHLSLDYGRFTAASTWLHILSGKKVKVLPFNELDIELIRKILAVVNAL